jgi:hypothetical protein
MGATMDSGIQDDFSYIGVQRCTGNDRAPRRSAVQAESGKPFLANTQY